MRIWYLWLPRSVSLFSWTIELDSVDSLRHDQSFHRSIVHSFKENRQLSFANKIKFGEWADTSLWLNDCAWSKAYGHLNVSPWRRACQGLDFKCNKSRKQGVKLLIPDCESVKDVGLQSWPDWSSWALNIGHWALRHDLYMWINNHRRLSDCPPLNDWVRLNRSRWIDIPLSASAQCNRCI